MLTAAGCISRRDRLWQRVGTELDCVVVADPQHLVYFTSFWPSPFVFRGVNAGAVALLWPDRSATLVTDSMLKMFFDRTCAEEIIAPVWYDGQHSATLRLPALMEHVIERLQKAHVRRVGYEEGRLPAAISQALGAGTAVTSFRPVDAILHELKRCKDPDEIDVMRKSMLAGDAAHAAALREVRPGMTELQVFQLVTAAAQNALQEQALVYGDFVSGPRCLQKGGPPSTRRVEQGDMLLLDFSVVVHGYRGDFTNSFVCQQRPTGQQQAWYAACLEALTAGEQTLRPGTPARDVDAAVRATFAGRGLAQYFVSHSGHGLGLGHPDPPYFVPSSQDTLLAGDVVALEPGIYIPDQVGMRIERNYLITETGFETLSHLDLRLAQPGFE